MMAAISFAKKTTKGLVSVVIPTYRKEKFIGETLASLGHQTYANWELIVVEDGSSSGAEKIVKKFARRHRWHRVDYSCNDRNYGAAHTRNVAFAKARGEYVALLDSDDRWFPDHLAVSVKSLEKSGKDITYSTVVMIEDQTDLILGTWGPDACEIADFPHSLYHRNFVTPSATVMRRQVLADVGPWDTNWRYCEDMGFWLRCVAAGKSFHYTGGCHCLYRKNHAGATTQRLCGTLEEFAEIVERAILMPGLREDTCRRYASKAYLQAARYHQNANPLYDTSGDRFRVAPLLIKAWRLRPKRVDHLAEGIARLVRDKFRRRPKPAVVPTPAPAAAGDVPRKVAA